MTRRPRLPALLSGPLTALVLLVGVAAPPARAADGTGQLPAPQVPAPQLPARQLQALLDSLVAKGAPGALAVVDDGRTRIRLASGAARLLPREPLRPDARFRVGSVTKTFVATVALQLVHERRLRLDDTVERWLPGLVPNGQAITVRMLLNHTSGLYNYTDDRAFLSRAMQNTPCGRSRPATWSRSPPRTARCSLRGPAGPTPTPGTSSPGS
jgi:D-alanyl-D-alanine carboxypeptidase